MLYGIFNSDNARLNNTPSSLHCDNRGNIKQELALRRNNLNQVKIKNGEKAIFVKLCQTSWLAGRTIRVW